MCLNSVPGPIDENSFQTRLSKVKMFCYYSNEYVFSEIKDVNIFDIRKFFNYKFQLKLRSEHLMRNKSKHTNLE